jgi:hypothetical protein
MVSVSGLVSARQTSRDKFLRSGKKNRGQVYLLETFLVLATGCRFYYCSAGEVKKTGDAVQARRSGVEM